MAFCFICVWAHANGVGFVVIRARGQWVSQASALVARVGSGGLLSLKTWNGDTLSLDWYRLRLGVDLEFLNLGCKFSVLCFKDNASLLLKLCFCHYLVDLSSFLLCCCLVAFELGC